MVSMIAELAELAVFATCFVLTPLARQWPYQSLSPGATLHSLTGCGRRSSKLVTMPSTAIVRR